MVSFAFIKLEERDLCIRHVCVCAGVVFKRMEENTTLVNMH